MARYGPYEINYPEHFVVGSKYGNLKFWKSGKQNGKKQQYYLDTFGLNIPEYINLHVYLDMEVIGIDEDGCYEVSYVENYYDGETETELEWENGVCYMDEGHIFMVSSIESGIERLMEEAAKARYRETKNVKILNKKSRRVNSPQKAYGYPATNYDLHKRTGNPMDKHSYRNIKNLSKTESKRKTEEKTNAEPVKKKTVKGKSTPLIKSKAKASVKKKTKVRK